MGKERTDVKNEDIIKLYCNDNLSLNKIAKLLSCDRNLVKSRLRKSNIRLKNLTKSEQIREGVKISVPINDYLVEVLNGEMLGDGSLISPSGFQAYFSIETKQKTWVEYLINIFEKSNIPFKSNPVRYRESKNTYGFNTRSTVELGTLHKIWYNNNKNYNQAKPSGWNNRKYIKTIPKDLKLTPTSLLHWFIGDGTIKNGKYSGKLCSNGFTYEEVEFLRLRMKEDLDINTTHYKSNAIGIPLRELNKLVNIIGKCPIKEYEYKWNVKPWVRNRNIDYSINYKAIEKYKLKP